MRKMSFTRVNILCSFHDYIHAYIQFVYFFIPTSITKLKKGFLFFIDLFYGLAESTVDTPYGKWFLACEGGGFCELPKFHQVLQ